MYDELNTEIDVSHYNGTPAFIDSSSFGNILYLNSRSLRNSLLDVQSFIDTQVFPIHVVVITETWLHPNETDYFNLIPFKSYHSVRANGRGGGVAIYVHEKFDTAHVVLNEDFLNNNFLIIQLNHRKVKIAVVYRQPNNCHDLNGNLFTCHLDNILSKHSHMLVCGDFNFNLFDNSQIISNYRNAYSLNGYALVNSTSKNFPTRITSNSSTCIDHVFTDLYLTEYDLSYNFYLFDLLADHKAILLNVLSNNSNLKFDVHENTSIKLTNHAKISKSKSLSKLNPSNFDEYLHDVIEIINDNTHELRIDQKTHKPYVTKEILNYIHIKNNYLKLKLKFPNIKYANDQYKFYKNKVTNCLRNEKRKYLNKFFMDNLNDPKNTWKQIKSLLYNKSATKDLPCEMLVENDLQITNRKIIVNYLNKYYSAAVIDIPNATNSVHNNHPDSSFDIQQEAEIILNNFVCPEVTNDEILLIISNLNNSKAVDIYGLSNKFVKIHKDDLAPSLTKLINTHLFKGSFPDCLKIGKITPVWKGGSKLDKKNYRPITVLPIFAKIFEYVIHRRLDDHFQFNNVLNNNQFGYTKGSGTETAVIHILKHVYESIDNRLPTALTCIDLSRAFDSIDHDILISKFKNLELPSFFLNLLESYLRNRKHCVQIENTASEFMSVQYGCPQGGVLSGLFFNYYINSIKNLKLYSKLTLYADDMTIVTSATDAESLKTSLESDLQLISVWLKNHSLIINASKSKYLCFHNRRNVESLSPNILKIELDGVVIERIESIKLLGLHIDEKLNFSQHIDSVHKKLVPFIFAFRRVRPFLSDKTALSIYFAYINSRIAYMCSIWNVAPKYLMESIEVLQRKALRIVLNKDRLCSRKELYSDKILPVVTTGIIQANIMVFKMCNNVTKNNFPFSKINESRHSHFTRNNNNFIVRSCNTLIGMDNFYVRALTSFNNLPNDIKETKSMSIFKNKLRKYYLDAIVR